MHGAQITNLADVRTYLFAGRATLTLVSKKTGSRFTYRVSVPDSQRDAPKIYFVNLLTGSDNESAYTYIGQIFSDGTHYVHGKKSRISVDAPGVRAFEWFARMLLSPASPGLPDSLEIWHEGKCGRCGRKLTVPESIERGIGPECADKMGMSWTGTQKKHNSVNARVSRPFSDDLPTNLQF